MFSPQQVFVGSLLYWDAAQHRLAECYQHFGTLIRCPRMTVTIYQPIPRNSRGVKTSLTLQQKSETTYIFMTFFFTTLTVVILMITNERLKWAEYVASLTQDVKHLKLCRVISTSNLDDLSVS
jgi:hypothetical protein